MRGRKSFLRNKNEGLIRLVGEEVGPRLTDDYEPRQIREEAAVNNSICITKQSGSITFSYQKIIPLFVQRRMHGQGSQISRTIQREIPISIVSRQINPYIPPVRQLWVSRPIPWRFFSALFDAG
jgi:hypothetical protein